MDRIKQLEQQIKLAKEQIATLKEKKIRDVGKLAEKAGLTDLNIAKDILLTEFKEIYNKYESQETRTESQAS